MNITDISTLTEKGIEIYYADPAGNITAIVRGADIAERVAISNAILDAKLAEQVGFECSPSSPDALGKLEMMGGEFCGNAARAYGYFKALKVFQCDQHDLLIEISGASEPVSVTVDLNTGEAMAKLSKPDSIEKIMVNGNPYPVVRMEGIDHLIAYGRKVDELWGKHAIEAMKSEWNPEACGVMFLSEAYELTPLVYVRDTDSLIWESSCGSGSVATAHYLCKQGHGLSYTFREPGGQIQCIINADNIAMGGVIKLINRDGSSKQ